MNHLLSVTNVSDRVAVTETNNETLDRSLAFARNPSLIDGVATTDLGAPTVNEHYEGEVWVDSLGAIFRCTAAGTPGTWLQVAPAVILTADLPADAPDNYLVEIADGPWVRKYWDGSAWQTL